MILGAHPPYVIPSSSGRHGIASAVIMHRTPNTVNALNVMMPNYTFCQNVSGRYFYCGYPEGMRLINRTGFNTGDSFVLGDSGGDEWVVFPYHTVNAVDPYQATWTNVYPEYGIAYKKVT
jgi:hypothetical protein